MSTEYITPAMQAGYDAQVRTTTITRGTTRLGWDLPGTGRSPSASSTPAWAAGPSAATPTRSSTSSTTGADHETSGLHDRRRRTRLRPAQHRRRGRLVIQAPF